MEIVEVKVELLGRQKDAPPSVRVRYIDERGYEQSKILEDADLTKSIFESGVEGEFWYDVVSGIEPEESE